MTLKEVRTLLAQDIERKIFRIQYDQCVRIVLSNKPILSRILKYTVKEALVKPRQTMDLI